MGQYLTRVNDMSRAARSAGTADNNLRHRRLTLASIQGVCESKYLVLLGLIASLLRSLPLELRMTSLAAFPPFAEIPSSRAPTTRQRFPPPSLQRPPHTLDGALTTSTPDTKVCKLKRLGLMSSAPQMTLFRLFLTTKLFSERCCHPQASANLTHAATFWRRCSIRK